MASSLVRSAHNATNSLHSLIYFAPETEHYLTGVGLRGNRMCYFAGRAAPMGAVGAGVVAATFYNFNPALVARSIPDAWELATPAAVIDARYVAVDAALTRLLGEDAITSVDMLMLAGLVREAAGACTPEGRPLYAGNADLSWPDAPHLIMWHALTLLREHRGDGHICALACAGLSGIEALVTHTKTGKGFLTEFAKASRGWSQDGVGRRRGRPPGPRPGRRRWRADRGRAGAARPTRSGHRPDGRRALAAPRRRTHRRSRPHREGHVPSRRRRRRLPSGLRHPLSKRAEDQHPSFRTARCSARPLHYPSDQAAHIPRGGEATADRRSVGQPPRSGKTSPICLASRAVIAAGVIGLKDPIDPDHQLPVRQSRPRSPCEPATRCPADQLPVTADSTVTAAPVATGTQVTVGSGVSLTLCICGRA